MTISPAQPTLLRSGDPDFDHARLAFNLTVDQRPELVARPADEGEVAEAVLRAKKAGLRVAPQRTGHNAQPIDWSRPAMLLRTDALQGVEIDAPNRRARVQGGARWLDLVDDASDLGLAALHGSARDIGIAGYSLGGGQGWLGRKHGLQANSVTAIELVTADGELVRADRDNEAELFWALRGGGGNFGVVIALEFDLYPLKELYAGSLFFGFERGDEVVHAWREWTAGLPEEVTSVAKLLQLPDMPEIPEPLRGKSFAVIMAAILGDQELGAELVEPLRQLGPEMDTFAMVPPGGLSWLAMDPEDPLPYKTSHQLMGELPAAAVDELIGAAGEGSGSPLAMVELRHLGGALARSAPHHGALGTIDGEYLMFAVGGIFAPELLFVVEAALDRAAAVLAPWKSGCYPSFVERAFDLSTAFDPESWRRLCAVRAAVDPEGLFLANHEIPAG
jgi:FAD/FMN-containing dehydrogenase